MAKKQFGLAYKGTIEINSENEIIVIETSKDGECSSYNLTEELKSLQNEANVNIKVSFDNEIIGE